MNLFNFIKAVVFCTVLAVIYIHMQMQIISLAYEGKKKEKEIISISERNGVLAYEILSLKSAHHLGERVLGEQSQLKFYDKENVVPLVTERSGALSEKTPSDKKLASKNSWFNIFAHAPAEASAAELTDVIKPWRRNP